MITKRVFFIIKKYIYDITIEPFFGRKIDYFASIFSPKNMTYQQFHDPEVAQAIDYFVFERIIILLILASFLKSETVAFCSPREFCFTKSPTASSESKIKSMLG